MRTTFRLVGLFLLLSNNAMADWHVTTVTDAMTDKKTTVAITENAAGYAFSVFRADNGAAWIGFGVPSGAPSIDIAADSQRVGLFRIDHLPAHDLGVFWILREYSSGPPRIVRKSRMMSFDADYDRREKSPTDGDLRELMDGKHLIFRYFTGDTSEDIDFDLDGAKPAIAKALGIPEDPEPDNMTRRDLWKKAVGRCPTMSDPKSHCAELLSKCDKLPDFSSKALADCLGAFK